MSKSLENLITQSHAFDRDHDAKELWSEILNNNGETVKVDVDEVNRPKFVTFQGVIELHLATALKYNRINAVVGVIHTKLPATPLRKDGTITEGLVTKEIAEDPKRLATVLERPGIIRNFLDAGGRLIAAYPESALESAIPGFDIYAGLQNQYPNNLVDAPIKEFFDEYTGATYLIKEADGTITCFSVKATQASSPASHAEMGIWFGSIAMEKVRTRFDFINEFLLSQGVDLMVELGKSEEHMKSKSTLGRAI